MARCICDHDQTVHWRGSHCLALLSDNTPCNCLKYTPYSQIQLSVLLNEGGESRVLLVLTDDTTIQLHPDACITLALEMISTANQARVKEALAKYARANDIPLPEVLS
jgi:hypothetical protein